MASPASVYPASTVTQQSGGISAANFPQVVPQAPTPNVTAANGFRPSIPPKGSRVPAGEIDKLSSSKTNNPLNGKSTTNSTFTQAQSLPPPPFPHPPMKGISNAQARTARKSAPSSSNRGDGYSTSSSGGGGRKSISSSSSGKNSKERKDRESLSISESPNESPIAATAGVAGFNRKRSPQQQTQLPIHFKQQPQQQTQQTQQEPQQQKGAMVSAIPGPPIFGGPSTQTASTKRQVSPTPISGKPKRQKIATPKAAALANEPLMNADGSAKKKRKAKGDKEKPRKSKNKGMVGIGMFPLGGRCPGEAGATISVAAKPTNTQPQRLPIPPPAYQVPAGLQRPNTLQGQQGQQEKKNSPITPSATSNILPSGTGFSTLDARILSTPLGFSKLQTTSIAVLDIQTPKRQKSDDVISISSSPAEPREEVRHQGEDCCRLDLGGKEQGNHQNMPITIDDVGPEAGTGAIRSTSPEEKGEGIGSDNTKKTDIPRLENVLGLEGPYGVSDALFTKCISTNITDGERECVLKGIIKIVNELREEASHTCKSPPISGTGPDFQNANNSPTLQGKLAALLEHVSVLTDDGKIITFNGWRTLGTKFKGKFILPPDPEDTKKVSGETGQPKEPQAPEKPSGGEGGCASNVEGIVSVVDIPPESPGLVATSCDSAPSCKVPGKTAEYSGGEKKEENSVPVSNTLQLDEIVSSPPKLPALLQPETLASPSQIITQPQEEQKPPQEEQGLSQEKQGPSDLGNKTQEEIGTSTASALEPGVSGAQVPALVSGKRKRKIFATPTVHEFLDESRSSLEMQSQGISSFSIRQQEKNDPLLVRIVKLSQEELSIKGKIETISAEAEIKERDFGRRIVNTRVGAGAKAGGDGSLNTEHGLAKNAMESPVDWKEYGKVISELRDFQFATRQEELRLADEARRVVEEKNYLLERRKELRQIECELETASSSRTSEERSVETSSSTAPTTAPSSVTGSLDESQSVPPSVGVNLRKDSPDMSVAQELLRLMIPWARQLQEIPVENPSSTSTETAANQVKSKKRPNRRKKHW